MTTWQPTEGVRVTISDAGRNLLDDEQRIGRLDRLYVEVKLGAMFGSVLSIAGLVLFKIWGM